MNEHLNQPEQNSTQVGNPLPGIYGSPGYQDPTPVADSPNDFEPYEETFIPYIQLPSESAQPAWQTSLAPVADSPASSPPGDTATQKVTKRNWGNLIALVTLPLVGLVAFLDLFDIIRLPHIVLLIVASINLVVILATRGKG
jgi:hypothetical protein